MYRIVIIIMILGLLVSASLAAERDLKACRKRFSKIHDKGTLTLDELATQCQGLSGWELSDKAIESMDGLADFSLVDLCPIFFGGKQNQIALSRAIDYALESRDPQGLTIDELITIAQGLRECDRRGMTIKLLPRVAPHHMSLREIERLATKACPRGACRQEVLEEALRLLDKKAFFLFEIVPLARCIVKTNRVLEFLRNRLPFIVNLDVEMLRIMVTELRSTGGYDLDARLFVEAGLQQLGQPKLSTKEFVRLVSAVRKSSQAELIVGNLRLVSDLNEENLQKIVEALHRDEYEDDLREAAAPLM